METTAMCYVACYKLASTKLADQMIAGPYSAATKKVAGARPPCNRLRQVHMRGDWFAPALAQSVDFRKLLH